MPPTPQSTLPLPPQPKVEQFETLAEDLLEACTREPASAPGPQAPDAIERWAQRWLESLAEAVGYRRGPTRDVVRIDVLGRVEEVAQFARERMAASCALSEAQAVIALWHGLPTWAAFVSHVESLAQPGPEVAGFEAAAEAIISGDIPTLTRRLREQPTLIRARSTREHQATLLHYVSANGVEGYRQISPQNIAEITKILLDAGAEVDARANVYGGGWTALGLVATSEPPRKAGVQLAVIDVLLEAGARMDLLGMRGDLNEPLLRACLANGQDEAATHLLDRGAPVDFTAAAGVGRLDLVERLVDDAEDVREGFLFACGYGHRTVVEFLLDRAVGVDVNVWFHGRSGLHDAAYHGHVDVVDLLVTRGADLDRIDDTYHTAPLIWALTGWQRKRRIDPSRYYRVVARLVSAGAKVRPDLLDWDKARADPQMMAALSGQAGPERAGPERAGSGQA